MYIEYETCTEKTLAGFIVDPLKPLALDILALMDLVIGLRHKSVEQRLDRRSIAWASTRCWNIVLARALK